MDSSYDDLVDGVVQERYAKCCEPFGQNSLPAVFPECKAQFRREITIGSYSVACGIYFGATPVPAE